MAKYLIIPLPKIPKLIVALAVIGLVQWFAWKQYTDYQAKELQQLKAHTGLVEVTDEELSKVTGGSIINVNVIENGNTDEFAKLWNMLRELEPQQFKDLPTLATIEVFHARMQYDEDSKDSVLRIVNNGVVTEMPLPDEIQLGGKLYIGDKHSEIGTLYANAKVEGLVLTITVNTN